MLVLPHSFSALPPVAAARRQPASTTTTHRSCDSKSSRRSSPPAAPWRCSSRGTELQRRAVAQAASAPCAASLHPLSDLSAGPIPGLPARPTRRRRHPQRPQRAAQGSLAHSASGSEALERSSPPMRPTPARRSDPRYDRAHRRRRPRLDGHETAVRPAARSGWFATPSGSLYVVDLRTRLDPIADPVGGDGFIPLKGASRAGQGGLRCADDFSGMVATAYETTTS